MGVTLKILQMMEYSTGPTFQDLRTLASDSYLYRILKLMRQHNLILKTDDRYLLLRRGKHMREYLANCEELFNGDQK